MDSLAEARRVLRAAAHIAVLTGAGVSAESGLATFRSAGGLWRNHRPEDLATPQAYARNPQLVWAWYRERFETAARAEPNAAHYALAQLESSKHLTLVTQNVDGLHRRAGSRGVLELHGDLTKSRCEACGNLEALLPGFDIPPRCTLCSSRARPNVVWFGEGLPHSMFDVAVRAFAEADVALIIGTSGVVEPAASLARLAKSEGALVIEVNPEPTVLSAVADFSLQMTAGKGLMRLLEL